MSNTLIKTDYLCPVFSEMLAVVGYLFICVLSDRNGVRGTKSDFSFRIIDGMLADIKEFPYQVSIMYQGEHHCGGSIISTKYILTAAHCANQIPAKDFSVRVGSTTIDKGGVVHEVEKVIVHPNFTSKYENDVALLELSTPLEFNNKVRPVKLAEYRQRLPPAGTLALVSGWGRTNATVNEMSPHLLAIEVPLLPHKQCQQLYRERKHVVDNKMFCAGRVEGGRDSCLGDSGGAIVINEIQYGIVSWGIGCALKNRPGVYASVPRLRKYIFMNSGV
ncbi:trypsin-3-like [Coccinella septempunctata]|uniref:trypsin-3-like n=1 Tax=Coccinella septempunctata TaxID=41139 RepID=UPI001D069DAA|nr:trypsin-3-like [Coccinella septempunctata]